MDLILQCFYKKSSYSTVGLKTISLKEKNSMWFKKDRKVHRREFSES